MKNRFELQEMKQKGDKITMVTAYDYPSAKLVEQASVDTILVGDSLGMVVLGYDSTIQVTVDDMIHHAKAVKRGAPNTFTVVDMPFMSYHISLENALENAMKIFQQSGANALKVEGASREILTLTERLTDAGIPVVAHLGLTPQSVNVLGGYKVQGKNKEAAEKLLTDSKRLEQSGAIALVLECIPKELAEIITASLEIPTIGIGAGADCDGQVLVYHDLLLYGVERLPKFVKAYGHANDGFLQSLESFVKEVKRKEFPGVEHTYTMNSDVLAELKQEDEEWTS
ncbi:3-methyl-2-oxobutanoate hydroxymethyltransferase [Aquibacillus koreensis]|uniref:3-methyl-2-oxobutanoate hydroxymethyltransferase n=1 Tax=Aquibacillus koreensis TaxID=279446 RepID=A0A9X4AG88_9BACI|nr:3-methyl-2-oxobutanoate hydroxymethyltransferase [Aquibacillus koreensis]MCT2537361.1 3-methyl-2-oxobutanoate hydroxymethyltransferase [Aquibacillus koreensis]MDC3418807.1 3-methyl-2-oxobutanoate hydroxymethyltransferase [Aquibacillus koreensis]